MKFVLATLATCAALPVCAQDPHLGKIDFEHYCATCHGPDARGDGPMSGVLTIPPTDLTKLAAEHSGTFPTNFVIAKIDGRDPLLAHGSEMPVYGQFFEGKGVVIRDEAGSPIMTSQSIIDLVLWLQSIQE